MKFFFATLSFILLCLSPLLGGTSIRDRLSKGTPGDFVVTAQGGNYSLLLIRDANENKITLEEIAIPQNLVEINKVNWVKWIQKRAPGAISWIALTIDLKKNSLSQVYSYYDHQWIFMEQSDAIVKQLLTLPFKKTRDRERKKIGPAPLAGEADRRKLWKPQLVKNGKKEKKAKYSIVRATWPKDKSRLAGSVIEVYLDAKDTKFPFPYWLEVQSPHYTFKLRTVDSGRGIQSPMPALN